jgi:hypothetical protein
MCVKQGRYDFQIQKAHIVNGLKVSEEAACGPQFAPKSGMSLAS